MSTRRKLQRQAKHLNPRRSLPELDLMPAGMPDVPAGMEDEAGTVMMMNMAWSGLSRKPECKGPLLVHAGGSFECHGDCGGDEGRSAMKTWHDLDAAVWPCSAPQRPPVDEIVVPCARCR